MEAPETAASTNVKLPIAIEQTSRGEIKTLQFIFVSPTQLDLRSLDYGDTNMTVYLTQYDTCHAFLKVHLIFLHSR